MGCHPQKPESVWRAQVLRCVDWGDVREARSAGDLIARWAPIGLADALELLSPAFSNPEVLTCLGHALLPCVPYPGTLHVMWPPVVTQPARCALPSPGSRDVPASKPGCCGEPVRKQPLTRCHTKCFRSPKALAAVQTPLRP